MCEEWKFKNFKSQNAWELRGREKAIDNINFIPSSWLLKGQFKLEDNKGPQTIVSKRFMEFFHISKMTRFLKRSTCQLLFIVLPVFFFFIRVTHILFCLVTWLINMCTLSLLTKEHRIYRRTMVTTEILYATVQSLFGGM